MFSASSLFKHPLFYKIFHVIFSGVKTEYLSKHLSSIESQNPLRVLDLGCGPGTNANLFLNNKRYSYLGIDLNPKYIREASKNYPLEFRCADITTLKELYGKYDIILLNSVIHHLSIIKTRDLLKSARDFISSDGECLVLDMVYPRHIGFRSIPQKILIQLDRGKHCRTIEQLHIELMEHFYVKKVYCFKIVFIGILLWDLRLFVCSKQSES